MGPSRRHAERRYRIDFPGWAALIAALCLVAGACGLRVASSAVHCATSAAAGRGCGNGTNGAGGLSAGDQGGADQGGAVTGDNGTAAAGPAAGGGGTGGATGPAGGGGAAGGGAGGGVALAAGCAPGGGATDTGVTNDTITIGNVSDLSGPVPGLFQGGPYGTQAYVDYVNQQGGVCGRKLKMISADDALDCSQNQARYQDLVSKVFAFVGSWSLDDFCGAQVMSSHTNVPMVQQALSTQFQNLPSEFSIMPYNAGAQTGYFQYFKQKYPDAIGSVGTLVGNQPSAVQAWKYFKSVAQSQGYTIKYEDDFPPAQNNFTADVIRMRTQGIKMVFIIAVNAPDLAIFSQEAYQQGWKPELFVGPIGYFGSYISEAGGPQAVEGQYVPVVQARFLGEDAGTVPEVANFDHWMKIVNQSFPVDQFAASSWSQAALFVQALQMAGSHLTRQGVLDALRKIHDFDDGGMVPAPGDIAAKKAGHCYALLQIQSGKYQRVDDPPTGYRCDGTFQAA
jgi:ABC-type branched-subunit amino acid transport system substrate-binding protein